MVHANVAKAGARKALDPRSEDLKFLHSLGNGIRERALLPLEPWDVGIAEHGNAVRLQRNHLVYGFEERVRRLMRKTVDQVEIDGFKSLRATEVEKRLRQLVGLNAMNGFLDERIEILHSHGNSVEAETAQRPNLLFGSDARVYFETDFSIGREGEPIPGIEKEIFDLRSG